MAVPHDVLGVRAQHRGSLKKCATEYLKKKYKRIYEMATLLWLKYDNLFWKPTSHVGKRYEFSLMSTTISVCKAGANHYTIAMHVKRALKCYFAPCVAVIVSVKKYVSGVLRAQHLPSQCLASIAHFAPLIHKYPSNIFNSIRLE